MKPEYDFLKSTTKKGGILLSAEWLEKNLGIKKGETIISASIGGKVLLTRFNPDVAFDAKALEMLASGNNPIGNEAKENIAVDNLEEFPSLNEQSNSNEFPVFACTQKTNSENEL